MGKMKISKKKKTNAGMPTWLLSTVVAVVLIGALVACFATVFSSAGVIPRLTTAMKSDNFKVNENMMKYFFQTSYGEFTSSTNYTTFEQYCSLNQGNNAGLTLDKQTIGEGAYDTVLAPDFEGKTWQEFFVAKTKDNVTTILSYCEEAEARGITLDDEDKADIESELEDMFTSIKYALYQNNDYNIQYLYLSDKECLTYYFGNGVSKNDVKDAMELAARASKVETQIRNELDAAISTDEISTTYTENPKKYELVDFLNYSFNVKYDQVSSDVLADIGEDAKAEDHEAEILAAYKAEITKAIERANALNAITDADTFLKTALEYYLDDIYDDTFESAKTAQTLADDNRPSAENEAAIKSGMVAKIFEELFAEDAKSTAVDDVEEKDEKFYAYGIEVTEAYGKFLTALKSDLYDDLYTEKEFTEGYKSSYPDSTEESDSTKWLFDSERKAGDTYIIDEGDGADGKEITAENKSFSADVYFMVKPRYLDTTLVRNGAYMVFTSSSTAQTALDSLDSVAAGEMTLEKFLEIAQTSGAGSYTELTDYAPGQLGSDDFDAWIFDSARAKGDYTTDIITISSSYVLGYYESEGVLEGWQAQIKNALLSDDLTAENTRITETYKDSIVTKDNVMSKLGK